MSNHLDERELATVLAALRIVQNAPQLFDTMPHFKHYNPLSHEEIENLCERLNVHYRCEDDYCPGFTIDSAKGVVQRCDTCKRFSCDEAAACFARDWVNERKRL
jgi:hypothetical protein